MSCARTLLAWLLFVTVARAQAGDDRYVFANGRGTEQKLALASVGEGAQLRFVTPTIVWDTALLGVDVAAQGEDPWLEITAGDARVEQHLEPGAAGLRWLSVSGLRAQLHDGALVSLRPHGLRVRGDVATLRVFTTKEIAGGPILVIAPHPDDAEIAAFGLYAQNAARTTIVTVTAGNAGDANYAAEFGPDVSGQYAFKGYLRAVDSTTVPWQGGVRPERSVNLGYFDGRLRDMHAAPGEAVAEAYGPNTDVAVYRRANLGKLVSGAPRSNSWRHLVEDLGAILRKLAPRVVIMPHPLLDSHGDHAYAAVAVIEALAHSPLRPTFLLYTNHAAGDRYPFGPAGTAMTLPPWSGEPLSVQGVFSARLDAELQRRKLFALESMHDLRLSPTEQASCGDPASASRDLPRVEGGSYFRRAVRTEETFLVLERKAVEDAVRAFLGNEAAARAPSTH